MERTNGSHLKAYALSINLNNSSALNRNVTTVLALAFLARVVSQTTMHLCATVALTLQFCSVSYLPAHPFKDFKFCATSESVRWWK